jgi:hypothetical protein
VLTYHPEYGGYINNLTGGLVDPNNIAGWKQNIADTKAQTDAWRTRNAQLEAQGLDAQSQALKAIADKAANDPALAAMKAQTKAFWHDVLDIEKTYQESVAEGQLSLASKWDKALWVAEGTQFVADNAVNVLANVTGPAGKSIKALYTVGKDVGKNLGSAHAKGTSYAAGLGKGLLESGFDLGFDALKGTKRVQSIPGFGKFEAPNISGANLTMVEKAVTQQLAHDLGPTFTSQEMIRTAFRQGIKGGAQSFAQKMIVKDPLKTFVGFK